MRCRHTGGNSSGASAGLPPQTVALAAARSEVRWSVPAGRPRDRLAAEARRAPHTPARTASRSCRPWHRRAGAGVAGSLHSPAGTLTLRCAPRRRRAGIGSLVAALQPQLGAPCPACATFSRPTLQLPGAEGFAGDRAARRNGLEALRMEVRYLDSDGLAATSARAATRRVAATASPPPAEQRARALGLARGHARRHVARPGAFVEGASSAALRRAGRPRRAQAGRAEAWPTWPCHAAPCWTPSATPRSLATSAAALTCGLLRRVQGVAQGGRRWRSAALAALTARRRRHDAEVSTKPATLVWLMDGRRNAARLVLAAVASPAWRTRCPARDGALARQAAGAGSTTTITLACWRWSVCRRPRNRAGGRRQPAATGCRRPHADGQAPTVACRPCRCRRGPRRWWPARRHGPPWLTCRRWPRCPARAAGRGYRITRSVGAVAGKGPETWSRATSSACGGDRSGSDMLVVVSDRCRRRHAAGSGSGATRRSPRG